MQRYPHDDPYERYPLDDPQARYNSPGRHYAAHDRVSPERSHASPAYYQSPSTQRALDSGSSSSSRSRAYADRVNPQPIPPRHDEYGYQLQSSPPRGAAQPTAAYTYASQRVPNSITPGANNSSGLAAGGMAGLAHNVADYSRPGAGPNHLTSAGQIPPPPSRTLRPDGPRQPVSPYGGAASYDPYLGHGQDSAAALNPFGTPPATNSPSRSQNSLGRPSSWADDPYQGYSSNSRHDAAPLGVVDPHDIEDDGDDGLNYSKRPARTSLFNRPHSGRTAYGASAAAAGVAAGAGSGAGAASRGLMGSNGPGGASHEKPSAWMAQQKGHSKTCKWITIILIFLVIVGAIVGGVVGALVAGNKRGGGGSSDSASDDARKNGDLDINSKEIKALMNNADLHRVFPGMDYTPYKTQYPDCISDPPSQNNVTRDVAVLSQLTNKIRLYGTDCNQTEMVIHAVKQLKLEKDVKIWMGVWQDKNETTNSRQLEQMWTILDQYGAEPFEGLIVANEILFRKEMTISSLSKVLSDVRQKLASKNMNLPVATSDLGDDWTADLAKDSDYIMANIHPFFAGVPAEEAASWTYSFWQNKDSPFWKTDKSKNIIAETGWPTGGGKNCGQATSCETGSVAGIKQLNRFMDDWVCQALSNGTQYFFFEAFDEPWKVRFNENGKEWEDKWGLMTLDRKLKDGVKIPDCGGKTI